MEYDTKCETVTDCTGGVQQDDTNGGGNNGGGYNGGGNNGGGNSGGALDFYGVPAPPSSVSTEYLWAHRKCLNIFLARCADCGQIELAH